jgi:hypothetical protein
MRNVIRVSAPLLAGLALLTTAHRIEATPLVFSGTRAGDALGGAVACSKASVGSHRRSLIAATASGHTSGKGAVMIYDPEAKGGRPRALRLVGALANCSFGSSLSFISDVNGDGVDDLVVSGRCVSEAKQDSLFIFRSARKGSSIGFSLCGSKREEGISKVVRHRDGFLVRRMDGDAGGLYGAFMTSSRACSLARASITPTGGVEEARGGVCGAGAGVSCANSGGCQAHRAGRLDALEVRGVPSWNDGAGRVEVRTRSSQTSPVPSSVTKSQLATAFSVSVVDDVAVEGPSSVEVNAGDSTPSQATRAVTPGEVDPATPNVPSVPGNADQPANGLTISPGSAGLPAPEVMLSGQNMASVILPDVSVRLTDAQRDRAMRLLMNRGVSKQKAEKALNNPKNIITTYIVTLVAESASVAARAVVLKARMVDSRGASSIRKLRSRRSRVSAGRLNPGTTYSVSYRVEISLKKPRVVLGVTKPSEATRFRAQ